MENHCLLHQELFFFARETVFQGTGREKALSFQRLVYRYSHAWSCITLNGHRTEWFRYFHEVKQDDTLSPTLFSFRVNGLTTTVNTWHERNAFKWWNYIYLYVHTLMIKLYRLRMNKTYKKCQILYLTGRINDILIQINPDKSNIQVFGSTKQVTSRFAYKVWNATLGHKETRNV